jgi:dienelactone hydrolase
MCGVTPPAVPLRLALVIVALSSPACMDHYALHPRTRPDGIVAATQEVTRGSLQVRVEWAVPPREGRLPTVIVHPEAGGSALDMRGVIWDLASHGYLAAAVDYRRLIDGRYRHSLFPWREFGDEQVFLDVVRASPLVDRDRLGLVGFSQGAVFSLFAAARSPDIRAVVAYYPVTDFEHWLNDPTYGLFHRFEFWFIRRYFRNASGARTAEEFHRILETASPITHVASIGAPVLLVHGTRDRTAPVSESRRLAERLHGLGRDVTLLEIDGAGHVFNFRDGDVARGRPAWARTLAWLDSRMGMETRRSATAGRSCVAPVERDSVGEARSGTIRR